MAQETFSALVLREEEGRTHAEIEQLTTDLLPDENVLVRVAYSDINYKDGLAVTGTGKIVRTFPMVPGIDLVGTVEESSSDLYAKGDAVIVTGWQLGESHWGGYSQLERVRDSWIVPLPEGLSPEDAMAIGTAGLTAMLSLMALEQKGLKPGGSVVVTGAAGGVGSLAVALLAAAGYEVVASTGRTSEEEYLRSLGASEIIDRSQLAGPAARPLESARWDGAVDTVGGDTLAGLLRVMRPHASIAACGNAGGAALNTTVFPFILRGVSLLGIDSNLAPTELREEAWARLASMLPRQALRAAMRVVPLDAIPAVCAEVIQGRVRGRVVVDVNATGSSEAR